MKKLLTILIIIQFSFAANAQDSCYAVYKIPVKIMQLSFGKLAYVEKGKGQTILFIHGLGGNLSHWLKSVQALSAKYTCIAIDLPGYGYSDKNIDTKGKDPLQFYADVVSDFIKKKRLKNIIVAGHSMGAQIAVITALQNKNTKKLILVSPAGLETFSEKEAQLLMASTPPTFFEKQQEATIRTNFKKNFFVLPADAEQLIQDRLHIKNCTSFKFYCDAVSAGIKGMLAHPVKDSLKYLTMSTLIIFGANDMLIPNKYLHASLKISDLMNESAALIPSCKAAMIDKAGHMVQFEKNNEINTIIKNFVQ